MLDEFTCLISVPVNSRAGLVEAESCRASPAYGGRKRLPNLFPTSITISFIWKDKRPAASLAPPGAFPIMDRILCVVRELTDDSRQRGWWHDT